MADATPTPTPTAPAVAPDKPPAPQQEKPSGDVDWQSKFEAQQKVNRDLEGKFNTLRDQQQTQAEALAKAFGLKPEETSDVSALASQVTALQEQWATTQHQNTVLQVANDHGISDPEAIQDLSAIKDEQAMRRLAARIKSSDGTPGTPKPDLTQGGKATPVTAGPAQDFASFLTKQLNG